MGRYAEGDVLLASVALDDRMVPKARPVVVIHAEEGTGRVHICPVSSKPPSDSYGLPLSINDFADGGLDLFLDSYIMTSRVLTIRSSDVIAKKGRLTADALAEITLHVPELFPAPDERRRKKGRS